MLVVLPTTLLHLQVVSLACLCLFLPFFDPLPHLQCELLLELLYHLCRAYLLLYPVFTLSFIVFIFSEPDPTDSGLVKLRAAFS